MKSVLQDWVMELPLREQGVLLTAVRGCDLAPKPADHDHDTTERRLTALLRFCVLNPADPREVDIPGAFFQSCLPESWKPSQLGHYPLHWVAHLMHAFQVVGARHPSLREQAMGALVYNQIVFSLHLQPESREAMIRRLSEDRIANGTVVS